MGKSNTHPSSQPTGVAARAQALNSLYTVLAGKQFFDGELDQDPTLDQRDRGFAHALVATVLRHGGDIDYILKQFLTKPLPHTAGRLRLVLKLGIAQLLFMDVPVHAAINQTVELAKQDQNARHFVGLVNAILRKVASEGADILATVANQHLNTPAWLWRELVKAYGEDVALAISQAHLTEAQIDVTVKSDPKGWADKLDGVVLPTGSIRLTHKSPAIPERSGFAAGEWWVQDAASALPVKLLGDVSGKSILDLCAAPGGKTAQLITAGAIVTAVDQSPSRMARLSENLSRLKLNATCLTVDVFELAEQPLYDVVLLDAPCSATGTLRRHPDLIYLKTTEHVGELVELQWKLLHKAAQLVKSGGLLLYCTCSLLPAEGEKQISAFLKKNENFSTRPINGRQIGEMSHMISPEGWLRCHPAMPLGAEIGVDGFFACMMQKH